MRCERPVRNNLQANAPFDFSPKWENAFGTLKKLYTELATMEAKVKGERESRGGEERRRRGQEGGTSLRASLHARPCSPAHCRSSLNRART